MNRVWILPLVVAVCITAVLSIVVATDDSGLLIPAPEDVAEGFLRALETRRFSPARQYLSEKSQGADLLTYRNDLEQRYGRIQDVRGDHATAEDDHAIARATLRTDRGDIQIVLNLTRENHLWKIDLTGR